MKTWRFSALDSWFFRESRPFDAIGGSELSSLFPPSPVTLAGAIRVAIGQHKEPQIVWANYPNDYPALKAQIGDNNSLGNLRLKGVFLSRKNKDTQEYERLYPVPAHLVATMQKDEPKELYFLQVGKPVHCDLGQNVRLPVAPTDKEKNEPIRGIKPLEDYWLTEAGFTKVLQGKPPALAELVAAKELFSKETRLGIGRNNQLRTTEKGLLYQTQHIRPHQGVAIEVDVSGLGDGWYPEFGIIRLGGEGRGAAFEVFDKKENFAGWADTGSLSMDTPKGIKLILLSNSVMTASPLPDFTKHELENKTVWKGKINSIDLTLECAIIGKAVREGGWDLEKNQPKAVRSFIPAGSVFYCTVDNGDIKTALANLKSYQLKQETQLDEQLGRGLFTACPWFAHDTHE